MHGGGAIDVVPGNVVDIASFPHVFNLPASDRIIQSQAIRFTMPTTGRVACTATTLAPVTGVNAFMVTTGKHGRYGSGSSYAKAGDVVYGAMQLQQVNVLPAPRSVSASCVVTALPVTDEAEPNDGVANVLAATGQAVHGSLSSPADVDLFTFTAVAGGYNVRLAKRRGGTALTLRSKNHVGTVIDTRVLDESTAEGFHVNFPAGTATLEVFADESADPPQSGGEYELAIVP